MLKAVVHARLWSICIFVHLGTRSTSGGLCILCLDSNSDGSRRIRRDRVGPISCRAEDAPEAPVVSDAGYGTSVDFREKLTVRGIPYVVGIQSTATLWPPGKGPLPPTRQKGEGGPPTLLRWDEGHRPVDALTLARDLPKSVWETVTWREGTKGVLSSRFARVTIRAAQRDCNRRTVRPVEWLLIEWPEGDPAPTKYWLSTMPPDTSMEMLVRPAKVRWMIERDHEELNQEFGLDQFEGRGRRGFHHHATRCIAAYGFPAAERARLSPLRPLAFLPAPRLPRGFHPRGSPRSPGAARQQLDHHVPTHTGTSQPGSSVTPADGAEGDPSLATQQH